MKQETQHTPVTTTWYRVPTVLFLVCPLIAPQFHPYHDKAVRTALFALTAFG